MVYVVVVVGALVCAIINWFFKDQLIIAGTALTGSYLFVSGIGLFAGDFPSIFDIYEMIKNKSYELDYKLYLYLGGILILALIGIIAQCKMRSTDEEEDSENEQLMMYHRNA